ncbi:MAG TPA: hypothetical protein VGT60_04275 [Candidatus Limnocylindria bacterium]|nr:hypothetical protein [Candidatus Limnocylindria bacterium]
MSADGRQVPATDADRTAADRFVAACGRANVRRVLVIGGASGDRGSLLTLLRALDIRAIDGTEGLTDDRADRLADWADVVVLWGAELHRTVTEHFGPGGRSRSAVSIVVDQPGIAALLDEATLHLPFGNRSAPR